MSSRSKDQVGTDKKGLLKNISNEHTPQENKTQGNIQVSISIAINLF